MKRKDITSSIERLEAFEKRLNVKFESLSAFETKEEYEDDHNVVVLGELHATSGTGIDGDIEIQLTVYDNSGRIIKTATEYVDSEKFFGFHTFEINCAVPPKTVAKTRLIPKLF